MFHPPGGFVYGFSRGLSECKGQRVKGEGLLQRFLSWQDRASKPSEPRDPRLPEVKGG